jgi:hypothetical protein
MEQNEPRAKDVQRARETLFRVIYQHQSKLIQIADYKANMNISLGAMIISAIIAIIGYGSVSGKIDNYSSVLLIPIAIVVFSCLLSLIFSIQAARPKLIQNNPAGESAQKSSLLFFGVIANFSQQEYIEKMKTLLSSESEIFENMTIDLHNQGVILKRKYNLLRHSYQILMYGFILSVLIFIGILLSV